MEIPSSDTQTPFDANAISDRSLAAARPGWRRWQVVLPVGLALAIVAGLTAHSLIAGKAKPAPAPRAVPVVEGSVQKGDMPVNLSGLGTVVPTDNVTVKTRVDGQVMSVNFHEGQMVAKGQLLIQIDPRPYQVQLLQAEGQLAKDQAALKDARLDLVRYQTLTKEGILPQQNLDTQVATVDQDAAAVKTDEAAIASAKLNLVYCHITAPVGGKVGLRQVDPGNMVHATDTTGLVVVTPVAPIDVEFTIPADNVQQVLGGSKGKQAMAVEAWNREFNQKLATGVMVAMDNQVDPTTGTVKIRAQFPNQDGALFPNQFVNAKLRTDVLHDALIVPAAAVQRSPQGNYVYRVKPDSTVELKSVSILLTEGDSMALKADLAAGDRVVVDGMDKLRPGIKVSSMPAATTGKP